jgi:hypothetical protein
MMAETFAVWMAESFLDVGAASLGRKYDKIDDIDCPISNTRPFPIKSSTYLKGKRKHTGP